MDGRRSWARQVGARVFCAAVLALQLTMVVRAYDDPLKRFGFQPFAESSEWLARIETVDRAGRRSDISQGFSGYRWGDLVRERVATPFQRSVAPSGIRATLYFLQRALDYVADHTPLDRSTSYFEAHVEYYKNHGPAQAAVVRSKKRQLP